LNMKIFELETYIQIKKLQVKTKVKIKKSLKLF